LEAELAVGDGLLAPITTVVLARGAAALVVAASRIASGNLGSTSGAVGRGGDAALGRAALAELATVGLALAAGDEAETFVGGIDLAHSLRRQRGARGEGALV